MARPPVLHPLIVGRPQPRPAANRAAAVGARVFLVGALTAGFVLYGGAAGDALLGRGGGGASAPAPIAVTGQDETLRDRRGAAGRDLDTVAFEAVVRGSAAPVPAAPGAPAAPPPAVRAPAAAAPAVPAVPALVDAVWDRLAQCESGGDWDVATGNGYYGGLQFDLPTWRAYGGTEFAPRADEATREQQVTVAMRVRADRDGYGAWPACSRKLGLPR